MPDRRLAACVFLTLAACTVRLGGDEEVGGSETTGTGTDTSTDTSTSTSTDTSTSTSEGESVCGDGVREGDEQCDGGDLGGASCQSLGLAEGPLLCTSECTFDLAGCGADPLNPVGCTSDEECESGQCYVVPFLGGVCGECNEDADCTGGGCTQPNPFEGTAPACNSGEFGGGCQTSDACQDGLVCATSLDLLGIQIRTCSECESDAECEPGLICAPVVSLADFAGVNSCVAPNSLAQDSYCNLEGNGDAACMTGICSMVEIMGLAAIGACGECNTDADCGDGTCTPGTFALDTTILTGSLCQ